MSFLKHCLFWTNLIFLFFIQSLHAQEVTLSGIIVNEQNNQPIPFANISVNEGRAGAISGIDGKFVFTYKGEINRLTFSCIGFETFVYPVNSLEDLKPFFKLITIKLFEKNQQLKEVVIKSGENPAHRLIKLAVQNRNRNNPEKIASFSYKSYNKFYLSLEEKSTLPKDSIVAQTKDSTEQRVLKHLENHHLFLTESISQRDFKAPNLNKETILANRVSGFKNPSFASLATDFQPFSFYYDFLAILNKNYLNPISKGSTEKYFFAIEDTVLALPDTIYIISFAPLPNKNFEGLTGTLYLNTKHYAIQNITASSIKEREDFISFKIQQKYDWLNDNYWFPVQMHTDIIFHKLKVGNKKYLGVARSYLQDIQLNRALKRNEFDEITLEIKSEAAQQPLDYWQNWRTEPLQNKDLNTYQYLDSLGNKYKADRLLKLTEIMARGRYALGKIDWDIRNALNFNRYEGIRLTAGFYTNEKWNTNYSLGAYLAYGTKDGNFKYGFSGVYSFIKKMEGKIGGSYISDVLEPGNTYFLLERPLWNSQTIRNILTERMDKVRKADIFLALRPIRNTQVQIGINTQWMRPTYEYSYIQNQDVDNPLITNNFRISEFSLKAQYAFGKEYLKIGEHKIFVKSKFPILALNFIKGSKILQGEFEYTKWEAQVMYSRLFRNVGTSSIQLIGGLAKGDLPYPVLFNGRGTTRQLPILVDGYFQTMELYEFASDRFLNVFLLHNFGKLLFRPHTKWFQPEFLLVHNIAWGSLQNPQKHLSRNFTTMEKGYFESGLLINNLLRFNYLDMAYWGLGLGAYYRYGAYSKSTFGENISLKLTSNFSF